MAGFWHHGVLLSDDSVVHYSGMRGVKSLQDAVIKRTHMAEFAPPEHGRRVHTVSHSNALPPNIVERRALSRVGHAEYNLVHDNCESFARWCVLGEHESRQAQGAFIGIAAGVLSLLGGGGIAGAALVAVSAFKFWDRSGNRSRYRPHPDDDTLSDA